MEKRIAGRRTGDPLLLLMGFSLLSEMEFFRCSEKWNFTQHLTTRYAGARRLLYKKLPFDLQ